MGGCLSIVPSSEVPCCRVCNKEGPKPWGQMNASERQLFVWEGSEVFCKRCVTTRKLEKLAYEKNRRAYKKAKETMYPKPTAGVNPSLKRIATGEQWDGTQSFYSGWRPPSTLKRLLSAIRMAQAEDPTQYTGVQRKGTGFVPAATGGLSSGGPLQQLCEEAEEEPGEGGVPRSHSPGAGGSAAVPAGLGQQHADEVQVGDLTAEDVQRQRELEYLAASHQQLAALEGKLCRQGLEAVEEESLMGDFSRDMSGLSQIQEGKEEGSSGASARQAQQQIERQAEQQPKPGKGDEFAAAGDSAYTQAEGKAAAGAGPAAASGAAPASRGMK